MPSSTSHQEAKVMLIIDEIEGSRNRIKTQKGMILSLIKLYFGLAGALFGYGAFLEKYILPSDTDKILIYVLIGVIFTLIVFIVGWVVQAYISNMLMSIVESKKHIAQMREFKNKFIKDYNFASYCVMPVGHKEVLKIRGEKVPVLSNIINFGVLTSAYYFLEMGFGHHLAFTWTSLTITIFSFVYPNVCVNFKRERFVAEKVSNKKSNKMIRELIGEHYRRMRENKNFKVLKLVFVCLWLVLIGLKVLMFTKWHKHLGELPIYHIDVIFVLILVSISYAIVHLKVIYQTPNISQS